MPHSHVSPMAGFTGKASVCSCITLSVPWLLSSAETLLKLPPRGMSKLAHRDSITGPARLQLRRHCVLMGSGRRNQVGAETGWNARSEEGGAEDTMGKVTPSVGDQTKTKTDQVQEVVVPFLPTLSLH